MTSQDLHIIDTALELLLSYNSLKTVTGIVQMRRLKNAISDCIRCFHSGEIWGEPHHVEQVNANIATLSAILMEMGHGKG